MFYVLDALRTNYGQFAAQECLYSIGLSVSFVVKCISVSIRLYNCVL
jgi:hypothetical protein